MCTYSCTGNADAEMGQERGPRVEKSKSEKVGGTFHGKGMQKCGNAGQACQEEQGNHKFCSASGCLLPPQKLVRVCCPSDGRISKPEIRKYVADDDDMQSACVALHFDFLTTDLRASKPMC